MTETHLAPIQDLSLVEQYRRTRLPIPVDRRHVRDKAGISLRRFAREIRVSHGSIAYYERGGKPSPEIAARYRKVLEDLAAALGYQLRYEITEVQK